MAYRKSISKKGKISGATEAHLLTGSCLIGFACEICAGNKAQADALGVDPHTLNNRAPEIWERNKERLLTIWNDPAGRERNASGFNATGYQGAGRLGLPCWAEIEFERVKLPAYDKTWPADVKAAYKDIKDNRPRGFLDNKK